MQRDRGRIKVARRESEEELLEMGSEQVSHRDTEGRKKVNAI